MKQATFVSDSSKRQRNRADRKSHGIPNADEKLHGRSPSTELHKGRDVNDGSEDVICSEPL